MKRIMSFLGVLALLIFSLPSFAGYYCKATNTLQNGFWTYHAQTMAQAQSNALAACNSSPYTTNHSVYHFPLCHKPQTCMIVNCWDP